jgi:hypothetical protein
MTDDGDGPGSFERGEGAQRARRLCSVFAEELPVVGASISVFDAAGRQSTVCASDDVAARIDEIQLELGEGPHWDALRGSRPVLVPDLGASARGRWPVFTPTVRDLGVRAVFALPMFLGAATVGVAGLYAVRPGALDARAVATAVRLTAGLSRNAVRLALEWAEDDGSGEASASPKMRREVHQATGMILAQLDITATEAFARLRAYAFGSSRSVHDIARAVVAREIDFRDLPE